MRVARITVLLWIAATLPAARAATAQGPEVVSARRSPPRSWTSDRRMFKAGDLITIFVDEETLATAVADNVALDNRRFDGILNQLPSLRMGLLSRNNTESEKMGRTRRSDRFQAEITARVAEVDEGGLLRLEGSKKVKVDKHEHGISIRGFVRPEDITGANVVDAWRISGLELLYESNGELAKPSKGLLAKLLSIVF